MYISSAVSLQGIKYFVSPTVEELVPVQVYEVMFTLVMIVAALLPSKWSSCLIKFAIILYPVYATILVCYYLIKPSTWNTSSPTDPDINRYSLAVTRSTGFFYAAALIILVASKIFGLSFSSIFYNYISLFVVMMLAYVYDRCVSTDDGLKLMKQNPLKCLLYGFLSFTSPAFMRFFMIIVIEISVVLMLNYFLGPLIPPQCKITNMMLRKLVIPTIVYSIITGPLRFLWAYPNVSEIHHVPYLTSYLIVFIVMAFAIILTSPSSPLIGLIILMIIIVILLQLSGSSNSTAVPSLESDATTLPIWAGCITSILIVLSTSVLAWRIFSGYLYKYFSITSGKKTNGNNTKVKQIRTK